MLTLILGGARSGKSRLAQSLAQTHAQTEAGPQKRVSYIATAERTDDAEMNARIDRHRAHRPSHWRTVEEPLLLSNAIETAASQSDAIIVDCITIWLSNLLWHYREDAPERAEQEACRQLQCIAATARRVPVTLVSNEVGSGIVPESSLARTFRDLQGVVNQASAALADEVILVIAGLPQYLKSAPKQRDLA